MSTISSLQSVTPALSIQPLNFAAEDPGVGGWRPLFEQARGADAAGIDRLVVSDHVVLGENLEAYSDPELGGTKGGRQPTGPDGHWLDPIVLLSMWAAPTSHTRLMTGILIVGMIHRERQGPAHIGFESVGIIACYLAGALALLLAP